METSIVIKINNELVDLFSSKNLTDEFIRKFYLIMQNKKNPANFLHQNVAPFNFNVSVFSENRVFSEKKIKSDLNSLEMEDIIEKAAIGFTFALFFNLRSNITDIEVLSRGKGYDYKWKEDNLIIKLEISGVNKNDTQTFNKRIYTKKKKFSKRQFLPYAYEELISIIDFYHLRYKLWSTR